MICICLNYIKQQTMNLSLLQTILIYIEVYLFKFALQPFQNLSHTSLT